MHLKECTQCIHGSEKDGHSHCSREAVYSYLSNCIQKKGCAIAWSGRRSRRGWLRRFDTVDLVSVS